jgi:hypothetical protein
MEVEGALDLVAVGVGIEAEPVLDVDALDHQYAVFILDLTARLRREPSVTRRDLTRLQRASERPRQSTRSGGDDVVERRRPLGVAAAFHSVMVSDLVVDAEPDRLRTPRQKSAPERAAHPLDPRPARVNDFGHY